MGVGLPDRLGRQAEDIRKIFGDLEIIEAKTDFVVYVTADEQENSERGNANKCMFSQACKRAFGSKGVLFYPTVAYVDMVDPADSTRRIVMRFMLPKATRERLEDFDAQIGGPREATFVLKAVPKKSTLAYQAKQKRKRYTQQLLEPISEEVKAKRKAAAAKGHETRRFKALIGVRSGSGQIHTQNGEDND